jgi:hypothetical protein
MRTALGAIGMALLVAGCGASAARRSPPDAGAPEGAEPDAGAPGDGLRDAGASDGGTPDAGEVPDAGGSSDAGVDAGSDSGPSDGGSPDAGSPDAGPQDAGALDAGPTDAGEVPDAGWVDAGGAPDAGPSAADAGPVVCEEAATSSLDIYAPVNVPLTLPADKGRILACLHQGTFSAADLAAEPDVAALGWVPNAGYEQFVIQYASESPPGNLRRVTALLFLPSGGPTGVPLAAVNHGTSGMGHLCGPSQNATALAELETMAMPLLARGYAIVATDYAGMGVDDGISPYTEGLGQALGVLDGIHAMWSFHDPRFDTSQLSGEVFVVGHSQGGQASLFAQQYYSADVGGTLLGSVSFAPAVGDMQLYHYLLGTSAAPTNYPGVLMAMSLYGNSTYYGIDAGSYLSASSLAALPALFHDECLDDLLNDVPLAEPTIGQMFTPDFVAAAGSCALDGGPCPGFEPWNTDLLGDEPGNFTSSVPVLIMQGGADDVVAPNFTACIAARLLARGDPFLACLYPTAQHPTIVGQSISDAYDWMETLRQGGSTPFCANFTPLPPICSPY